MSVPFSLEINDSLCEKQATSSKLKPVETGWDIGKSVDRRGRWDVGKGRSQGGGMAFWRTYYHLVWATEARQPLITPDREAELYGYMLGKADAIGVIVHAIGGVEDHLHLVVSIPPKLAVAEFVKLMKGSSAYHLNHQVGATAIAFGWQQGYGVFTLGSRQLDQAKTYVLNQKQHHQQGTAIPMLESVSEE
jgi:putative transposase